MKVRAKRKLFFDGRIVQKGDVLDIDAKRVGQNMDPVDKPESQSAPAQPQNPTRATARKD